jgi:hypothetical protein
MSLRRDAIEPHDSFHLARFDQFLAFLDAHLSPADAAEAKSLLHAAISPAAAAARQR